MAAPPPTTLRSTNVVRGVVRVACGRPDGINQFSGTIQAFVVSLALLIAFPLAGAFLNLLNGGGESAIADFLATIAVFLAPPVLSFELARLWGRQDYWLRFATAFNWCQWLLPVLASVLLMCLGVLLQVGLPEGAAAVLLVTGLGCYALWLHWFLARHGLALSGFRAALLVAGVNLGTALLVLVPQLLALQRK